ncbi:MAG TPA: hypothetical protein VFA41_02325 [Ktedonobacteraceae bacterium]|jgi:hypothetical protein|nr:hypothetical protein [Ktedonobacteraceae bacterium]
MLQESTSLLRRLMTIENAVTPLEKRLEQRAVVRYITHLDVVVLVGIVLCFVSTLIDAVTRWWYVGAVDVFLALYWLAFVVAWKEARTLLGRFMLAGLIAGICELFTDASGHYVVHSLIYPVGEWMLWASPIYMPLSWVVILTHLGYVGWRLRALPGLRPAMLVCGLWGAIQIPLYEEMAYYGGWWRYTPTHLMLGHTPAYVLLFEGLIVACLPLLYDRIERRSWLQVTVIGIVLGAWMPFAALAAWLLLGH